MKNKKNAEAKAFIALSMNAIANYPFALWTYNNWNWQAETITIESEQWAAQQFIVAAAVFTLMPIVALVASKRYDIDYHLAVKYVFIFGVASIATIYPWNYFQYLGEQVCANPKSTEAAFISSLFPGLPQAIVETCVVNALSKYLDPHYKFSSLTFTKDLFNAVPGAFFQLCYVSSSIALSSLKFCNKIPNYLKENIKSLMVSVGVTFANWSATQVSQGVSTVAKKLYARFWHSGVTSDIAEREPILARTQQNIDKICDDIIHRLSETEYPKLV